MSIHHTARHFSLRIALLVLIWLLPTSTNAADTYLIQEGQPQSEIIISGNPSRSTRLAADELQTTLQKITGAKLKILFEPSGAVPLQIFVGESPQTKELGLDASDLKWGAYRIVSGEHWLALLGDDADFVPREPWARNNNDRVSGKHQRAWEELLGEPLGVPNGGMYKNRSLLPPTLGLPAGTELAKEREYLWGFDERGSYNAVCEFLRSLGVRWYLPGELGEVMPQKKTISLPKIDETVKPDFEVRRFNVRFSTTNEETMKWAMRLGVREPYGLMVAHGMHTMTHTAQLLQQHPDWFALYGGQRDNQPGERLNHLCYSNEELFQAAVRWAKAQFDIYDYETVSIMPPDAYIAICQCPLCEGKQVEEMGSRGKLSNHVWEFVNRVAKEVGKTHPEKNILCCAYGANTNPPSNIDQLEPNVQVVIVGGRRPRETEPEQRKERQQLFEAWQKKSANPLMIFENYPFTDRGYYLPAFISKTQGDSINRTKGISRGEDIWLSFGRDFDKKEEAIGFNHFQVYFTARMYWGGSEQDPALLLKEYCQLFYGPAGQPMQSFFEFCEFHFHEMEQAPEKIQTALDLFEEAKSQVSAGSVYAERLDLIDHFLETLRRKAVLLAQSRGPLPQLRTVWEPKEPIIIDGQLDDQYWRECPTSSTGRLRELQTGSEPIFGTQVMTGWDAGKRNLYFAIRCQEHPGEKLNIATKSREDQSIWYGDVVEFEIATDSHSYYQIAINPAEALVDLDRGASKESWYRWESQAEVATHIAHDHWIVEIRFPITDDTNDPLNQIVGRIPSSSIPWHINICRQRIRKDGAEHSALSPTGTRQFHVPNKFAYFYDGGSTSFDVDPTVTDLLLQHQKAVKFMRTRKDQEALEAFLAIARHGEANDFQISRALQHAVVCALNQKNRDQAESLADHIPLAPIAQTVQMQILLAQSEPDKLIEQFEQAPIQEWPFWLRGEALHHRGRASYLTSSGARAETDLSLALPWTSDTRTRHQIMLTLGNNREKNLHDSDMALMAYQQILKPPRKFRSSQELGAIQAMARILTRQKKYDQALKTLQLAEIDALSGTWKGSLLRTLGDTFSASGRTEEALKAYQQVLSDPKSSRSDRQAAEQSIKTLSEMDH